MKSIAARFIVPFGLMAALISVFVFYQTYETSRKHALELISRQAAIALEFNLAIRSYGREKLRPEIAGLVGKDVFHPETMSTSFISRSIFESVREKFPEFIIRYSSENPRNLRNMATPDERRVMDFFRKNPGVQRLTEQVHIEGRKYLAQFSVMWLTPECLRCHGDPGDAPAELVSRYGPKAGFGRQIGDIAGLDVAAVPIETINAPLDAEMLSHSIILAVGFILLIGSIIFMFRFFVTRRLTAMKNHFNDIAHHADSERLTPVEVKGNDEISVVGIAFNKLVEQLRETHALLEERVDQRTEELRKTNEQLQLELTERKRAEEALKESRQQMENIIDFLPDATFVIDLEGRVIAWNRAVEEMTGVKAEDILGRSNYEYALAFHGERRPLLVDLVLHPELEAKVNYLWLERKEAIFTGEAHAPMLGDGKVFLYATASVLRDSRGNPVGAIESIRDISKRRRAEAALAESEQRFSVFMDHLPACVFMKDADGRVLFANSYIKQLFGWDQAEGKRTDELLPAEAAAAMMADDLKALKEGPISAQECIIDIFGAERFFDTYKFPISIDSSPSLLGGIAVDVTERKLATEALRESERKYRVLIDTTDTGYTILDEAGIVCDANVEYARLSGHEHPRGIIGRCVSEWTAEHDRARNADKVRECVEKGWVRHLTLDYMNGSGGFTPVEINAAAMKTVNGTRIVALCRDITERKRAQEEKEKLEARLSHAHKMEAVGTLAGGIAHDFNNILAAIIGYAEIALITVPRLSPIQHHLQQVLNAGQRAKDLVRQILTFSRMQPNQERTPVEVAPIVREALNLLRASLPAMIEIRQTIQTETGAVLADPTEIHQVLVNLCTNAGQAMEQGGGILEVSLGEVLAESGFETAGTPPDLKPGKYLLLTVRDTGHGMDQPTLDRIFDPYFTTKDIGKGSGLGLSVVHGIIKRHEGTIAVFSKPGSGTTFKVYLPQIERKTGAQEILDVPVPEGAERILFVDDEKALADIGKRILEHLGYCVTATTSSTDAFEIFRTQPDMFDLIITDYTMPLMTGTDLAEKAMHIRPDIPVILCTGFTEQITEEQAREMNIRAFVLKPLNLRDMAGIVKSVLDGVIGPAVQ
jgi:PAS domain S-box-containing protein